MSLLLGTNLDSFSLLRQRAMNSSVLIVSGITSTLESFFGKEKRKVANILVIDDEESVRYSFHRFLTRETHSVSTAACYCMALSQMNNKNFDLILADLHLPDGWGIDIINEVARKKLMTRVIIMTAYPCNETITHCLGRGVIDYLIKPLRQKALIRSVNNALLLPSGHCFESPP